MDENMRKAMSEAADKYFYQYRDPVRTPETLIGVMQIDEHFKSGVEWCLEYLGKAAGEFDESAFAEVYQAELRNDKIRDAIEEGARWQFEQDQARIALAEKQIYELKILCDQKDFTQQNTFEMWQNSMKREETLEAKLSAAEDESYNLAIKLTAAEAERDNTLELLKQISQPKQCRCGGATRYVGISAAGTCMNCGGIR